MLIVSGNPTNFQELARCLAGLFIGYFCGIFNTVLEYLWDLFQDDLLEFSQYGRIRTNQKAVLAENYFQKLLIYVKNFKSFRICWSIWQKFLKILKKYIMDGIFYASSVRSIKLFIKDIQGKIFCFILFCFVSTKYENKEFKVSEFMH